MEKAKDATSKMSQAALKAWETRRKNAASSSSVGKNEKKNGKEKKKTKKVIDVADAGRDVGLSADEKKEMMVLNGVELEKLSKQTQKMLDRRDAINEAKNGKRDLKAVSVGKIIKKAKIERFNGGIKLTDVKALSKANSAA